VLKIEGRSKGADYVQIVTKCYREAIESLEQKNYTQDKIDGWMTKLSSVYNRGFWEGYYLGRKLGEWTPNPGSAATEKKVYVGKGTRYYPKIKVGEFLVESGSVKVGDTLMITGPAIGMAKEKMELLTVNGVNGELALKGDKITFPFEIKITHQDKLYKIVDVANG
jgi:putative protease